MTTFNTRTLVDAAKKTARVIDQYDQYGRREQWWAERCSMLNQSRPYRKLEHRTIHRGGESAQVARNGVLDIRAVGAMNGCGSWGDINNRPEVFMEMVDGLLQSYRTNAWESWTQQWTSPAAPVTVQVVSGFKHDLVNGVTDGRHRLMAAAILDLPELPATISRHDGLRAGDEVTLSESQERAHLQQLLARGYIENPSGDGRGFTVKVRWPAEWSFDTPASVEQHTRAFRASYPAASIDQDMLDADAWRRRHGTPAGRLAAFRRRLRGE